MGYLFLKQLSKGVLTLEESGVGKSELDEDGVDDNKGEGVYELVDNKGDGVDDFLLSLFGVTHPAGICLTGSSLQPSQKGQEHIDSFP